MADDVFGRWLEVNAKLTEMERRLMALRAEIGKGNTSLFQVERDVAAETARIRKVADAELACAMDRFRKEKTKMRLPGRRVPRM